MIWIVLGAFLAGFLFGVTVMAVLAMARDSASRKQESLSESITSAISPGEGGENSKSDLYRGI
jgi:hypothetical protein